MDILTRVVLDMYIYVHVVDHYTVQGPWTDSFADALLERGGGYNGVIPLIFIMQSEVMFVT